MAFSTTLFPPIVDTVAPAFEMVEGEAISYSMKIYFDMPPFLGSSSIKESLQYSVVYQNTNKNAIIGGNIKISAYKKDIEINRYYIEITNNDISVKEPYIPIKVQMRFMDDSVILEKSEEEIEDAPYVPSPAWLTNNLEYFSEWSTVCITQGVPEQIFTLSGVDVDLPQGHSFDIMGRITGNEWSTKENNKAYSNERVATYGIKVINEGFSEEVLFEKKNIPADDQGVIRYSIPWKGIANKLIIKYVTNNLYEKEISYGLSFKENQKTELYNTPEVVLDYENGRNIIKIDRNSQTGLGLVDVYIRRRAYDKYKHIESEGDLIFVERINGSCDKATYYYSDLLVEAGKRYDYSIKVEQLNQGASVNYEYSDSSNEVLVDYEHIYSVGSNGRQLKLEYNPTINNFKHNTQTSQITTIGSQYPYIFKNGKMNYLGMGLSFLISEISDESCLFISKEDKKYINENLAGLDDATKEFYIEKIYRDNVEDFFNEAKPVVIKSLTEGIFLVKATDISMSPNQILGRKISTAQLNFIEIGEASLDNYKKYSLINQDRIDGEEYFKQKENEHTSLMWHYEEEKISQEDNANET